MTAPNGGALAALPDLLQIALPAAAFARMEAGEQFGKLVLSVRD